MRGPLSPLFFACNTIATGAAVAAHCGAPLARPPSANKEEVVADCQSCLVSAVDWSCSLVRSPFKATATLSAPWCEITKLRHFFYSFKDTHTHEIISFNLPNTTVQAPWL